MDYLLYEVIHLPEWEAPPACTEEALMHLARWDYGEYCAEPVSQYEAKPSSVQSIENHDYFLARDMFSVK